MKVKGQKVSIQTHTGLTQVHKGHTTDKGSVRSHRRRNPARVGDGNLVESPERVLVGERNTEKNRTSGEITCTYPLIIPDPAQLFDDVRTTQRATR